MAQIRNPTARREPSELSGRGQRTRARLIASARQVFAAHGYFETKLAQITSHAGVAAGTFYTYFDSREALLAAIIAEAYGESINPVESRPVSQGDPFERIRHGNEQYVESYRRNADVHRVIAEAVFVDPAVKVLRHERATQIFERNAQTIAALQARGAVGEDIDPVTTARNLSLLVSRACHFVYVENHDAAKYRGPEGAKVLAAELSELWIRCLGVQPHPAVRPRPALAGENSPAGD